DGKIVNTGGRVLGVTGLGSTVAEAIACAYGAVDKINWSSVHFRKDIGKKALNR
ncbi:MAG: phosphoribosylamine--glycine ligase, partial [Deltaproteobacteria bacterium]|nr:phosphoribosylamine--glycine ligase [Deltaproteobacteria bacterium]